MILHVDAAREWRGGQTQLLALATRIGGPVVVHPEAPLREALERAGVETVVVPFRGRWWGTVELWAAIRRFGPALIAAHDGHGAAHSLRLGRVPVVVHRRVDFVPSWRGARRYREAAGVIAVSEAVARIVRRAGVTRVRVVHDGVDPAPIDAASADRAGVRAELGLGPETPLVCAVGALVDHKAHHLLIRALPHLERVHLVVLGEGPLGPRSMALAAELGVDRRLHLVGHRADVGRWLKSADTFAHPSVEEGLGQAVIEAAFAGIPMVVSHAGGLSELGVGIPVAPGDVIGLARAVRRALGGVEGVDRTGLIARFGVERMVADTVAAYRAFTR